MQAALPAQDALGIDHVRIAIIGLGYVGLPLAVEFARKYPVVGFDVKKSRIDELKRGEDSTREVDPATLRSMGNRGQTTVSTISGNRGLSPIS